MPPTLVLLAAGMGSRYGGPKQIDPVGPGGATLIDYAAWDARRVGFDRVVLVVRSENHDAVRAVVGPGLGRSLPVDYAIQDRALPDGFRSPPGTDEALGNRPRPALRRAVSRRPLRGAQRRRLLRGRHLPHPGGLAGRPGRGRRARPRRLSRSAPRSAPRARSTGGCARWTGTAAWSGVREVLKIESDGTGARYPDADGVPVRVDGDTPGLAQLLGVPARHPRRRSTRPSRASSQENGTQHHRRALHPHGGAGPDRSPGGPGAGPARRGPVGGPHLSRGPPAPGARPRGAHRQGRLPEGAVAMSEPTSRSRASQIVEAFAVEGRLVGARAPGRRPHQRVLGRHLRRSRRPPALPPPARQSLRLPPARAGDGEHGAGDPPRGGPRRPGRTRGAGAAGPLAGADAGTVRPTTGRRTARCGAWFPGSRAPGPRSGPRARRRPGRRPRPSGTSSASWRTCRRRRCTRPFPGFHDTPARLEALERAVAADEAGRVAGARREIEALLDRRSLGGALAERVESGELPAPHHAQRREDRQRPPRRRDRERRCASWTSTPSCPGSRSTTSGTWSGRW